MAEITRVAGWLGLAFGVVSVFLLIQQGYKFGLAAPLHLIFGYYDAAVQFLGQLFGPPIEWCLAWIGWVLGIELHLRPGWKHGLVAFSVVGTSALRGFGVALRAERGLAAYLALILGFLLLSFVVGAGPKPGSVDGLALVVALMTAVLLVGLWWLFMMRGLGNRAEQWAAWRLLSVPLGLLFLLATNAGLRLIPGL